MKFLNSIETVLNRGLFLLFMYLLLALMFSLWFHGIHAQIKGLGTSFFDCVYFSFVTITTLGYGDMYPLTHWAKILVMIESVFGIIIIGLFLADISLQVVRRKERKQIDTAILGFKSEYGHIRNSIIDSLLVLSGDNHLYNSDEIQQFYDLDGFKKYFQTDEKTNWYAVSNNLDIKTFYTKEILYDLELLQNSINMFIMQVPIEDVEVMNLLKRYSSILYKMRRMDLDDSDDRKLFMGRLWELMAFWSFSDGYHKNDPLLEAIEKI